MITVYDENTTLDKVRETPLVRPEKAGRFWKGVRHGELVDTLMGECKSRGWSIEDAKFSLAKDDADLVGAFKLLIPDLELPEGVEAALGFATSNAMTKSLRLYCGGEVTICNNGLATGELVLNRKHTTGVNLSESIRDSIDRYKIASVDIKQSVEDLRHKRLHTRTVANLLNKAGDARLMPKTRLWKVASEYWNPRHPEHGIPTNEIGTGWSLLNAFTEIVKGSPPQTQMRQTNEFRKMILAA